MSHVQKIYQEEVIWFEKKNITWLGYKTFFIFNAEKKSNILFHL